MPVVSPSEEANKGDGPEFKWGKQRGVGGPKKEIKFYESFTYDGITYSLYDCVYLHIEAEPEPYIGKLVKIWEQGNHKKKIKVIWFFRPIEISNWLGADIVLENEIFLASGNGPGHANINPLETLVGKCNVVCTSKDERNPQPSYEDIKAADYVFFRTFDVDNCTISDSIKDTVGGVEVRYLFNQKDELKSIGVPKRVAIRSDESEKVVAINGILSSSSKLDSPAALKISGRDEKPCQEIGGETNLVVGTRVKDVEPLSDDNIDKFKTSKLTSEGVEDKPKAVNDSHLSGSKTSEKEGIIHYSSVFDKNDKSVLKSTVDSEKEFAKGSNLAGSKAKVRPNEAPRIQDARSSKKAKISESSFNPSKDTQPIMSHSSILDKKKPNNKQQRLRADIEEGHGKDLEAFDNFGASKGQPNIDCIEHDKVLSNKKNDEKKARLSEIALNKAAFAVPAKDNKTDRLTVEVSRRPDADRSKWFKGLPWGERLQTAHEQGTLVLLENLDPRYTSSEIEDIIWHGFEENCTAKVIQQTLFSSPHCGRAFVIFKSREAAEMAVTKLDQGCLMLPNGRPLVGSKGTPVFPQKPSKFIGHLFIDKIKLQMQREEMKKAVSTSHCSQPNTIEYEMAMEWRLLQEKSDKRWKELYKLQGEELRKVRNSLKTK